MRKVVLVGAFLGAAAAVLPFATAQTRLDANARATALVAARLESQQPVRLSGETITLTGDTLRLSGRAMIRFDDTSIRAEEIVLNAVTKRVEWRGNVNVFYGRDVAPLIPIPPTQFR